MARENSSNLEHVAEVGVDVHMQIGRHRLRREVLDSKGLKEASVPKQPASMNCDLTGGDELASAVVKRRVGQMCGEDDIVAADCPAEELRDRAGNAEG